METPDSYIIPDDFDCNAYRLFNKDVGDISDIDCKLHYVRFGKKENRRYLSSNRFWQLYPEFDAEFYRSIYDDLKSLNDDELMSHFMKHGVSEHRIDNINNAYLIEPYIFDFDKFDKNKIYGTTQFVIIIRTHKRPIYFKECLLSVINQTYQNYKIIVVYDDQETYDSYLYNYNFDRIQYLNVIKNANNDMHNNGIYNDKINNKEYNLYFNDAYKFINDNSWIIHLDDDNMFVSEHSLKILLDTIIENNNDPNIMYIWKHNMIGHVLPLQKCTGRHLDTNMFTFHSLHKNKYMWSDNDMADNEFIHNMSMHAGIIWIDQILTSINTYTKNAKIRNNGMAVDKYKFEKPHINNIDFSHYAKIYDDVKMNYNERNAHEHWTQYGSDEGRIFKLKRFDLDVFDKYYENNYANTDINNAFVLITSIYEEENEDRRKELQYVIKKNNDNKLIKKIIVFFDRCHDANIDTSVLINDDILMSMYQFLNGLKKVTIIMINGKFDLISGLSYIDDDYCETQKVIMANADILITNTFGKICEIDLLASNSIITLTRHDVIDNVKIELRNRYNQIFDTSQDCWIFEKSKKSKMSIHVQKQDKICMGTWNCENEFNHFLSCNGVKLYNCCRELITIHIHNVDTRQYLQNQSINVLRHVGLNYLCEIK